MAQGRREDSSAPLFRAHVNGRPGGLPTELWTGGCPGLAGPRVGKSRAGEAQSSAAGRATRSAAAVHLFRCDHCTLAHWCCASAWSNDWHSQAILPALQSGVLLQRGWSRWVSRQAETSPAEFRRIMMMSATARLASPAGVAPLQSATPSERQARGTGRQPA